MTIEKAAAMATELGIRGERVCNPDGVEDHYIVCRGCGAMIDCRDLGEVFSHEVAGPHPAPKSRY